MARPLRLEYSGALYHVTSRGDRREDIYLDDTDRNEWLAVLGKVCGRFNWVVHAYCQMTNHYHFLVETADGNLSKGMRQLNGQYTQRFNTHHRMVGHLFQGRYKAILIQKNTYLLQLSRYIVLNPLRAGMVDELEHWQWSSYRAMVGLDASPQWLDNDWLLSQFGKYRKPAIKRYHQFVQEGIGLISPLHDIRHQLLLGDESFIEEYRGATKPEKLREISKAHRRSLVPALSEFNQKYMDRNEAMSRAYSTGAYTMAEIGEHFSVHYMTVSRAVRKFEDSE